MTRQVRCGISSGPSRLPSARRAHTRATWSLLQELVRDYEAVADLYSGNFNGASFGSSSAALPLRRKVLDMDRHLAALRPGEPRFARGVAVSISKIGDELWLEGRWAEAAPYY
jgi:hypothetical protein